MNDEPLRDPEKPKKRDPSEDTLQHRRWTKHYEELADIVLHTNEAKEDPEWPSLLDPVLDSPETDSLLDFLQHPRESGQTGLDEGDAPPPA